MSIFPGFGSIPYDRALRHKSIEDAKLKAAGKPTQMFRDVKPSPKNPEIADPMGVAKTGKGSPKVMGIAKTRKETLKNVPDQKIIKRGKDYRSRITSRVQTSGVTKRRDASRPNLGSRVAALLKPKTDKKKTEDKLG